jgi:hypothetical protein
VSRNSTSERTVYFDEEHKLREVKKGTTLLNQDFLFAGFVFDLFWLHLNP